MGVQLDLFSDLQMENPLKGKRVCLSGSFRMSTKEMNQKLKNIGVEEIDRVADTKVYKKGVTPPPVKEKTDFFIVGSNPHEESLKRLELNAHDGFHARMITEEKLYAFLDGKFTDEDAMPEKVKKELDLTYDYYNWTPPVINGKEYVSRTKSPLNYYQEKVMNPVVGKEIYIPEIKGVNMNALRQIMGNMGGYANLYMDENTFAVMLSDATIEKWEQGIKDDTIKSIEATYNKSNSKMFNICFTSVSDFINWVKGRIEKNGDQVTRKLIEQL